MIRNILSTLTGLVVAMAAVFAIELLSHQIRPPPPAISDMSDKQALRDAIAAMPFGALASVALAWIVGTFAGALVATKLSCSAIPAWFVGGFIAIAGIANMLAIPHPLWFWVVACVLIPAAAFSAARLGAPKTLVAA